MLRVCDLMSRDVVTVSPDLSLRETVGLLDNRHITGAPVVSNGQVVGVISVSDLMSFEAATPGVPRDPPRLQEWEFDAPSEWEEGFQMPPEHTSVTGGRVPVPTWSSGFRKSTRPNGMSSRNMP